MPRHIHATAAAAVMALVANAAGAETVPHLHGGDSSAIVTLAAWEERMQIELQRQMSYPVWAGDRVATGVARVKFNCSASGRPAKVTLQATSGNSALDRAAMRAVSRMASLHPLPTGFTPDTRYEAVVLFTTDGHDAQLSRNDLELAKRNAWYHDPQTAKAANGETLASR